MKNIISQKRKVEGQEYTKQREITTKKAMEMDMRKKGNEVTNERRKYSSYKRKQINQINQNKDKKEINRKNKEINKLEKSKIEGQKTKK